MNRCLLLLSLLFSKTSICADTQARLAHYAYASMQLLEKNSIYPITPARLQNYLDSHVSAAPEHDDYKPEHYTPNGTPLILTKQYEQAVVNPQSITLNNINNAKNFPHA